MTEQNLETIHHCVGVGWTLGSLIQSSTKCQKSSNALAKSLERVGFLCIYLSKFYMKLLKVMILLIEICLLVFGQKFVKEMQRKF